MIPLRRKLDEEVLFLNPFTMIAEDNGHFLLNGSEQLQARFAQRDRPILELLMSGGPFRIGDLTHYLARGRINELRAKRVLLSQEAVPPLIGRDSRQCGFFSLFSDNFESSTSKLCGAEVLLLGAGAIGSHVLWNLAAMGVGRITVVDFDTVDETNLNRQLMYSYEDLGEVKADVLCSKIGKFNPAVRLTAVNQKVRSADDIDKLLVRHTLVIKAIDTPEDATELVNVVCVKRGVPFIAGGFVDYLGVVGPIYLPGRSPCAACWAPRSIKRLHGTGASFAPLTTIVSSVMSMYVFKIIVGAADSLADKMYVYDSLESNWHALPLSRTTSCVVCGREPEAKSEVPRGGAGLWAYRASIVFVLLLVDGFRLATHNQYIGLLALCVLVLSLPMLDVLCERRPDETRRQMFVISCIYCVVAFALSAHRFVGGVPGTGFGALFAVMQQVCSLVVGLAISITLIFLLLNVIMLGLKFAAKAGKEWIL
jgi:molybdopterin/thiamine biosynthesis adenylyltransferase